MTRTRAEILEQPEVLARVIDRNWDDVRRFAAMIRDRSIHHVLIAARGTSDHAAIYAKYLLGANNGMPVTLATPSLYTFYQTPPRLHDTLVIGISQSGASTDIVEVVQNAQAQGCLTLAITNNEASPLAESAQLVLPCLAGEEKGVAATKTYTSQLVIIAMLSVALNEQIGNFSELQKLPAAVSEALETEELVAKSVERYRYAHDAVVLSRGLTYGTASEIALKVKELAYVLTQSYSTADFMHGPLASVYEEMPVLAVVPSGVLHDNILESLEKVRERGAELVIISDSPEALAMGRVSFQTPNVPEWLSPITTVIPGQWFAHHLALTKGYDPDRPRAIRKVMVTL